MIETWLKIQNQVENILFRITKNLKFKLLSTRILKYKLCVTESFTRKEKESWYGFFSYFLSLLLYLPFWLKSVWIVVVTNINTYLRIFWINDVMFHRDYIGSMEMVKTFIETNKVSGSIFYFHPHPSGLEKWNGCDVLFRFLIVCVIVTVISFLTCRTTWAVPLDVEKWNACKAHRSSRRDPIAKTATLPRQRWTWARYSPWTRPTWRRRRSTVAWALWARCMAIRSTSLPWRAGRTSFRVGWGLRSRQFRVRVLRASWTALMSKRRPTRRTRRTTWPPWDPRPTAPGPTAPGPTTPSNRCCPTFRTSGTHHRRPGLLRSRCPSRSTGRPHPFGWTPAENTPRSPPSTTTKIWRSCTPNWTRYWTSYRN